MIAGDYRTFGKQASALSIISVLAFSSHPSYAQLEEVVVTTRKKAESLQDVPLAVDAFTSEMIDRQGVVGMKDIANLSPSLQFDVGFSPADTRITLRGLSNSRGRSNVAFLVDGIDVTTENFIAPGSGLLANQRLLNDVERIEVVKGPQSALYGRAAFAGAISYITKEPGEKLEGRVRIDAAQDGFMQVDGAFGGPVPGLKDSLGFRVSGVTWTDDGRYQNSISGDDVGGGDGFGLSGTLLWTPTNSFQAKLRTEYSDDHYDVRPVVRTGNGRSGESLQLLEYPEDAITVSIANQNSNTFTNLIDFGQFCPPELMDPNKGRGVCLSESFGNASGHKITQGEDPLTGTDFEGTNTELLRLSAVLEWELPIVTISYIGGYTDYEGSDAADQDFQAIGRPDTLQTMMETRNNTDIKQFSNELRFSSNFDGPLQVTLGGLYWDEDRRLEELDSIITCMPVIATGSPGDPDRVVPLDGICDGSEFEWPLNNGIGLTETGITTWQERYLDAFPCVYEDDGTPVVDPNSPTGNCLQGPRTPTPWQAETDHKSFYFSFDLELTDKWKLGFENRTIWEEFEISRPNYLSCVSAFFIQAPGIKEVDPVTNINDDIVCISERSLNPAGFNPQDPENPLIDFQILQGTEKSSFNTPKITLEWLPTDSSMIYLYWAKAQKPGGFNQASTGGVQLKDIDDFRFESEKMQVWELGTKTDWEAAGSLRINGAVFFQDYTDKQVGTTITTETGVAPSIENASAAEVLGLELELTWLPSFLDGLLLSGSYTYLHAEYKDWIAETGGLLRPARTGQCQIVYTGREGTDPDDKTDPANGRPQCAVNMDGQKLERQPKHAFVGNVQLTRPLGNDGLEWFTGLTGVFQDERYLSADNFTTFDSYWLFDARLGIASESLEFLIYINNLMDDDTIRSGTSQPDFGSQASELGFTAGFSALQNTAQLPVPRLVGARLMYKF